MRLGLNTSPDIVVTGMAIGADELRLKRPVGLAPRR